MNPLIALAPPISFGGHLVAAALGFGLSLALASRLRGTPPVVRCCLAAVFALVAVVAMGAIEGLDRFGVTSFILGAAAVLFAGTGPAVAGGRRPRTAWLAVAAIPVGLCMGFLIFGVWFWQSQPEDRITQGWSYAGIFSGFGLLAGVVAAVLLLGLAAWPRERA